VKNARFSFAAVYLDADGDPLDPTTPDSEISKDNGAFADCAEEVTTASGSNGAGLLTLTGAETDVSMAVVCLKVASGPKATLITLYPRVLAVVGSGTLSAGSAGGGTLGTVLAYDVTGCFLRTTGGTGGGGTGGTNNQARRIVTYNTGTGAFTVSPNWETTPSTDTTYDVLLPEGVTLGMLRALNPTTPGRTADVAATGEIGLDFDNIHDASGSHTLTNITVPTVTTVTNQLTAAAIATGVWQDTTAGDFTAVGSIGKSLFTSGNAPGAASGLALVGSNVGTATSVSGAVGSVTGSVGSVASGGITSASFAAGAIDAAAIATDALGALELAAGAASEIAAAVWDLATSGHTTSGTFGAAMNAAGSAGDPWATTVPGAYGAGTAGFILGTNLNATVSSRSSHTAAQAATAVWTDLTSGSDFSTVASVGKLLKDNVNATISSRSSHTAADVWAAATRTLSDFAFVVDANCVQVRGEDVTAPAAVNFIQFWDNSNTGSSRLLDEVATVSVVPTAAANAAAVWAAGTRTLSAFSFTVTANAVTLAANQDVRNVLGTVADKTGYSLAAAGLDAISVADPGAPANHTTLAKMIVALWRAVWKKSTMTATQEKRFANDGTTVNATAALSDDLTTQTRGDFT
jgi:hypothetical protein